MCFEVRTPRDAFGPSLWHVLARATTFTLLGIDEYLHAFQGDTDVQKLRKQLADRLLGLFEQSGSVDWQWCEDLVTYDNARLPQALIVSGSAMGNAETPVGIGVSGKFNHMVGVRASGTILAINPDPGALVFECADVGIVGDWQKVLPALVDELERAVDSTRTSA